MVPRPGEAVAAALPDHPPALRLRRAPSPSILAPPEQKEQIETLRQELHTKDSTITELKNQLKDLQTIVEQLTKENSVLKTNSVDDDNSMTSQFSMNESASNVVDSVKSQERGRSLETDELTRSDETDAKLSLKAAQRPVSMFEAREGPKNNWQVTKHQVLIWINFTNFVRWALNVTQFFSKLSVVWDPSHSIHRLTM